MNNKWRNEIVNGELCWISFEWRQSHLSTNAIYYLDRFGTLYQNNGIGMNKLITLNTKEKNERPK